MANNTFEIDPKTTAVVSIDIQRDYFWGGKFPLWRAGRALKRAMRVLDWARQIGLPVIHLQHFAIRPGSWFLVDGTPGTELHPGLGVRPNEIIIPKHWPNSFRETDLEQRLREQGITTVVWMGMITWMCVDTTVRAAFDLGFRNILISDATAAGVLLRNAGLPGIIPPWRSQSSFLGALGTAQAKVTDSRTLLKSFP